MRTPHFFDAILQGACAPEDDSDQAKQQRFLDFFKDLGDQYWGWQNESARRGRGFKGALKENFLPLRECDSPLVRRCNPPADSPAMHSQGLAIARCAGPVFL